MSTCLPPYTKMVKSDNGAMKRLAIAAGQLGKVNKLRNARFISIPAKLNLLRSLIISIALHGYEKWGHILNKKMDKKIEDLKICCYLLA